MKYFFWIWLSCLVMTGFSQSQSTKIYLEEAKVKVYIENGRQFTKSYRDSLVKANFFVRENLFKSTEDTTYISLVHFDKSIFATNYKKLGIPCKNLKSKSLTETLNASPYNKIASISLVSFKKESDTTEVRQIPKSNGQVDMSKMFEEKKLTEELKNNLLDVLVNYGQNGSPDANFCTYLPRNAIVFLNKEASPIGYIEICFQCHQFKTYFDNLEFEMCNDMLHAIQGFFMKTGIKYGMKYDEGND